MPLIRSLTRAKSAVARLGRRLGRSTSGLALTEFALSLPVVTVLGFYGLEAANLALVQLRLSQISANLADTASRIGETSPAALKKIRESDINDAFEAVRLQSGKFNVTTHGRVFLSSLEQNASTPAGQWIHWQRCVGRKNVTPQYGVAGNGATGTGFPGMGPTGNKILAPAASAVMFVEIIYDYQPLISNRLFGPQVLRAKAAFLVRDRRDLTNTNTPANPAPTVTPSSCTVFNT